MLDMSESVSGDENDAPDVAALREALAAIREEYEDEDVPAVKAGLSIAFDAVRVVLNKHTRATPPDERRQ
jgi:hypothetical protein